MKRKNKGFTMVELLTVVGIIALLVGLLIPAVTMVRKTVKETQQRAQLTTIDLALLAFKNDQGYYPPSSERDGANQPYCGAQKLAEALLGQDLLGFHPDSVFRRDGTNVSGTELYPDNLNPSVADGLKNMEARMGPYLDVATANAFKLGNTAGKQDGLFDNTQNLDGDRYVICDVFGVKRVTITPAGGSRAVSFKAGTPILYYRANTSNKKMNGIPPQDQIYDFRDNIALIALGKLPDPDPSDPQKRHDNFALNPLFFYDPDYKIIDPKVSTSTLKWPHRADSYILISAGADGEYGTSDDICNF